MMKKLLCIIALVLCIALVGCGNQEVKTGENENTNNNNSQTENEVITDVVEGTGENADNVVGDIEFYSDDTKYVIKYDDNTTATYYHDGKEISGYEIVVEYETEEEAKAAKLEYTDYEEDDVESLTVVGNTLVAKYKKAAYEDMTLEELKQTIALLEFFKGYEEE